LLCGLSSLYSGMELVKIGKTLKPYGVNGEIRISLDEPYIDVFPQLEVIFLSLNGTAVPHFPEQFKSDSYLLKLEETDSPETAKRLSSSDILARKEDIPYQEVSLESETLVYGHLVSFLIIDQTLGSVGTIKEILEFPQQEMAVLELRGNEVLIPLNDSYIIRVDKEEKEIHMDLPDGLIDLDNSNPET